ncbi:hypothetical protein [Thalassospira xiamenensis]|uniref:Uncharacterized protein n=1 Tax=Thalassospira xiamenensis TaxID=220697 RepID=A0ABR5XXQ4_9PROT|nr:hypothetical protein [Thalassospira xiamenensis]KZC97195.1 hypothetical protein AUP40_04460 [Thalassospira xiamenensis]KZD10212.1 hypothetical protein AUP45_02750 [Thalassospira xiamenensis]MCD1593140.1 hypothetical protein [Thalassospira xiamenensis]
MTVHFVDELTALSFEELRMLRLAENVGHKRLRNIADDIADINPKACLRASTPRVVLCHCAKCRGL